LAAAGAQDLRISFDQRLFVPGLRADALPQLLKSAWDLGLPASEQAADLRLVVCAGPDTCNRGLVNSKALGKALQGFELPSDLRISGCQNGCSQHLVAPLGLQGTVKSTPKGRQPCYVLRAGLPLGDAGMSFGPALLTLPARRVRPALERLSAAWKAEEASTPFADWLSAQPKGSLEARLGAGFNDGDDAWLDHGSDRPFEVALGGSECH
jgi:sulfite reductase (NADPH) hemoprotein beta-component